MMRIVFTFCLIIFAQVSKAGCFMEGQGYVNGIEVIYFYSEDGDSATLPARWAGPCYVDQIQGNTYRTSAHIYFQPGDTVYIRGHAPITQPGSYRGYTDYCGGMFSCDNYFICSYLTDTLETYYQYHFDKHFIDSLAAVKAAIDDSIAAVPAVFYPNPVIEIAIFQCFHIIQTPFDFQLFDLQGRCVLTKRVEFSDSYQSVAVDMTGVLSGTYIAHYFLNNQRYTRQIVKL